MFRLTIIFIEIFYEIPTSSYIYIYIYTPFTYNIHIHIIYFLMIIEINRSEFKPTSLRVIGAE